MAIKDATVTDKPVHESWDAKLENFKSLQDGWNGYTAPAPNQTAIKNARGLLKCLLDEGVEPTRVAPSAMGGIAVTRQVGHKKGFVEFYNDGKVYALFSDRESGEMNVVQLANDRQSFQVFIADMQKYLNG